MRSRVGLSRWHSLRRVEPNKRLADSSVVGRRLQRLEAGYTPIPCFASQRAASSWTNENELFPHPISWPRSTGTSSPWVLVVVTATNADNSLLSYSTCSPGTPRPATEPPIATTPIGLEVSPLLRFSKKHSGDTLPPQIYIQSTTNKQTIHLLSFLTLDRSYLFVLSTTALLWDQKFSNAFQWNQWNLNSLKRFSKIRKKSVRKI